MGQDPAVIREEIEDTRERMGETADAIAYRADVKSRAMDTINDKVNTVREKVMGTQAQLVDAAHDSIPDVRGGVGRAAGMAQENPLGLAIGGAAIGFIAGLVLPTTRVEQENLGPIADQVKEQAIHTGEEALEHGKQIAHDAVQGATEGVHESGQQHVEELKASAQDSLEEIKEVARQ